MSIKDTMEVGQTWKCGDRYPWMITGCGKTKFLCNTVGGDDSDECFYYSSKEHWIQLTNSDGTPFVPEKVEPFKADPSGWDAKVDDRPTDLSAAPQFPNYIGWEDDEGTIHGKFRNIGVCENDRRPIYVDHLTAEEWESGEWEAVKPVKLWFERGGGE